MSCRCSKTNNLLLVASLLAPLILTSAPAADPSSPAAADTSASDDSGANTSTEVSNTSSALTADALASILNGAQTPAATASSSPVATPAAPVPIDFFAAPGATPSAGGAAVTPAAPSKGLTLESLQGALGNLANQPTQVPLTEVLEPGNVIETGILDDDEACGKLLPLLPAGQQTKEFLAENIRSPQVRQALASLQSAVAGDSFNSVIANFDLDTSSEEVREAMNRGDGVAAFLEAIVKKHQQENK